MTTTCVLNPKSPLRPVLVVEDNEMDVDFCLQALIEHSVGNPIYTALDGEDALAFIDEHPLASDPLLPLLVLLDLRLPKVDGIEVLRHAREHEVWKQVPFVVLTTSRENADVSRAYALGANSYIVKPVDFVAFAGVVSQVKLYWLLTNEPPFADPARRQR